MAVSCRKGLFPRQTKLMKSGSWLLWEGVGEAFVCAWEDEGFQWLPGEGDCLVLRPLRCSGLGNGPGHLGRCCSSCWGQWARACLLSPPSFMALLWLKTRMKIMLKICKLELQVWSSQVYSRWVPVNSSD